MFVIIFFCLTALFFYLAQYSRNGMMETVCEGLTFLFFFFMVFSIIHLTN